MIKIADLLVKIGADSTSVDTELDKVSSKLMDAGGKIAGAGAIMTAGITAPLVMLGKSVISAGMAAEQSQVAFSTLLGSGEKAKVFLGELQEFAGETPFEFNDLEDASKRMLAFGFSAEQILPMMTAVGDATSGLGAGAEGVNRVVLALGQMQAKAKASSQEMMQLTETGIPAWKYLASAMGMTTGEAMKMVEKGLVPAEQAINAITQGMEQDFGGMMAAQMNTAAGGASNLADALDQLKKGLGTAILPEVKKTIEGATKLINKFNEMDDGTKKFIMTAMGITAGVGPVLTMIGGMGSGVGALIKLVGPAANGVKSLGAAFSLMQGASNIGGALSVAKLGISGLTAVALPAAAAITAIGIAYDKTVGKANREGQKAISSAWGDFFESEIGSGKSAIEILEDYEATSKNAQKNATDMAIALGSVGIGTDTEDAMYKDLEGLNIALAESTSSYEEYLNVVGQSEEVINEFNETEWSTYHAISGLTEELTNSAAGLQEIATNAGNAKTELDGLVAQYGELQTAMQNWQGNTAGKVMNAFDKEFPYATEEMKKQVMGITDEVFGTSYLDDYEFDKKIQGLLDTLHNTNDFDAFKKGMQEINNEGLTNLKADLDKAASDAATIYQNLLALPKDIQVQIGFDDSKIPNWVKNWMMYGNGFGSMGVGTGGFGVTLPITGVTTTITGTPGAVGTFNGTDSCIKTKKEALGGPVWSNTAYWVGERGPEMFVPSENGRIEPNPTRGVELTNYGTIMLNSGEMFGVELLAALAV